MSFNLNNIEYIIVRERQKLIKTENINKIMQRVTEYMQQQFSKACRIIIKQINKCKKKINYEIKVIQLQYNHRSFF